MLWWMRQSLSQSFIHSHSVAAAKHAPPCALALMRVHFRGFPSLILLLLPSPASQTITYLCHSRLRFTGHPNPSAATIALSTGQLIAL
jgi:hypothetical protein